MRFTKVRCGEYNRNYKFVVMRMHLCKTTEISGVDKWEKAKNHPQSCRKNKHTFELYSIWSVNF